MEDHEKKINRKRKILNVTGLIVFISVIVIWKYSKEIQGYIFPTVGTDQFSIVSSLFSALSVAGVIYAILLQSIELELQRNEIKQSTEQLKDQKIALQEQSKTMMVQLFEGTFTTILKSHHDFVSTLVYRPNNRGSEEQIGNILFISLIYNIDKAFNEDTLPIEEKQRIYNKDFYVGAGIIIPYLKSFDVVLRYIERSEQLSQHDKGFYNSIVDAQLSKAERRFIRIHMECFKPFDKPSAEIVNRLKRFEANNN